MSGPISSPSGLMLPTRTEADARESRRLKVLAELKHKGDAAGEASMRQAFATSDMLTELFGRFE